MFYFFSIAICIKVCYFIKKNSSIWPIFFFQMMFLNENTLSNDDVGESDQKILEPLWLCSDFHLSISVIMKD